MKKKDLKHFLEMLMSKPKETTPVNQDKKMEDCEYAEVEECNVEQEERVLRRSLRIGKGDCCFIQVGHVESMRSVDIVVNHDTGEVKAVVRELEL